MDSNGFQASLRTWVPKCKQDKSTPCNARRQFDSVWHNYDNILVPMIGMKLLQTV